MRFFTRIICKTFQISWACGEAERLDEVMSEKP